MGSLQNLMKWVKEKTIKKKNKPPKNKTYQPTKEIPNSRGSPIYGFHRIKARDKRTLPLQCDNSGTSTPELPPKSRTNVNKHYGSRPMKDTHVLSRSSPFRIYNDSPAHIYEEIPGNLVATDINKNEQNGDRLIYSMTNLDFTGAKEVGPYLVVPIRKKQHGEKDRVGFIRTKDLVEIVQGKSLDNLNEGYGPSQMCSQNSKRTKSKDIYKYSRSHDDLRTTSQTQVIAEIHHHQNDSVPNLLSDSLATSRESLDTLDHSCSEQFVHCKKCKRPHGIYNEHFMDHYDTSDDNVFDEPDLIKDSQVKGSGYQSQLKVPTSLTDDSYEESEYGIREQIYSTTDDLQNSMMSICSSCQSKEDGIYTLTPSHQEKVLCVNCEKEAEAKKSKSKGRNWKKYVSMGHMKKSLFSKESGSKPIDIPKEQDVSYSSVSTRMSPNTQLLLDGKHYKTLPIDIVTPVKCSKPTKKPFGYDKLDLSTRKKPGNLSNSQKQNIGAQTRQLIFVDDEHTHPRPKDSYLPSSQVSDVTVQVPSPRTTNPRSASCSDIIDDIKKPCHTRKPRTASQSEECEYMTMLYGSSPNDNVSMTTISSLSECSPKYSQNLAKKKEKILKSISRSKESLINLRPVYHQKTPSNTSNDSDIYNCDAETKKKVHQLTRNKLSSTWNGPKPPPKREEGPLSRHSTLPNSFSPNIKRDGAASKAGMHRKSATRSSDALLQPKQLSYKDFHTLNRPAGVPGPLYLKQGSHAKIVQNNLLKKRRFASSSDCLLPSSIVEESDDLAAKDLRNSSETLAPRRRHYQKGRSLSYDANAQTYTNALAIAQHQIQTGYKRRHNPILSDLMRKNNDRQTLMLV